MKLFVSGIVESYRDKSIGHLRNLGKTNLLLHIVQCWHVFEVDKENWGLTIVLYCLGIIYKYYSRLGFIPTKQKQDGKQIHNEIFNNIPHFIKNSLHVNFSSRRFCCVQ